MLRLRASRPALTTLLGLGLVLGAAGTAAAHVEVNSSTAQALAVDATVAFSVEGESSTAGITDVKVTLPAGLTPADITPDKIPDGWKLTPTADGWTVAGPALAPGAPAEYSVKVRQLPAAGPVVFKTLVDYADGRTDRWIELPQGDAKPEHPAPALALRPAAAGATPVPAPGPSGPSAGATQSVSATATATSSPSASADAVAAGKPDDDEESTTTIVLGGLVAVAVLGTVIALLVRRRSNRR